MNVRISYTKKLAFLFVAATMLCALGVAGFYRADARFAAVVGSQNMVIVLDAGHGGADGGAVADDGTPEKNLNLDIALRLRDLLEYSGYTVLMTRTTDTSTGTGDGYDKAEDIKARLELFRSVPGAVFVSIHQNKFSQSRYSGAQVFYSSNNPQSAVLAQCIQKSVREQLQPDNNRETKPGDEQSYILKSASDPAVIVECGFLSNPQELALLKTEEYRAKMAFCIYTGLVDYERMT